jgi:phage-related protein
MKLKPLVWIGSSKKDLIALPEEIKEVFGYALYVAQNGSRHPNTKILQGFGGAGVIEIKESDTAGTYRAVYTVHMEGVVFVLHAFQKKSKQGIKTPQADINLIRSRLKEAQAIYEKKYKKK